MSKLTLFVFLVLVVQSVPGQKIQYSHQTFKKPYAQAMQLVAVGGAHHVICFNSNKSPVIYVFNAQMQASSSKVIDIRLKETHDIKITPFKDHYFLYFHSRGSHNHYLYLVRPDGSSKNVSDCLSRVEDSTWNWSKATFQLFNQNEKLAVVTHTYYGLIKRIKTSVIKLDDQLKPVSTKAVFFEFDAGKERLGQVLLVGERIVALKTAKNMQNGGEIKIVKVDLDNGESIIKHFDAGPHLYLSPSIHQGADSSFVISSVMREPQENSISHGVIFMCKLGDTLQELAPVSLFKRQFRNHSTNNFMLVDDGPQSWLHLGLVNRLKSFNQTDYLESSLKEESSISPRSMPNSFYDTDPYPASIRFTLLDSQLQNISDSLVENDDKTIVVKPFPFARFSMNNKAYLVLIQNYTRKKRGLLMVTGIEGGFLFQDIRVVERYEYLLMNLQYGSDYFILPYTYKKEMGLVKITLKD